jgi:hypothetical protein
MMPPYSEGFMAVRSWLFLLKWPIAVLLLAGLIAAGYLVNDRLQSQRTAGAAGDKAETPKRGANSIIKLGAELAESHGVKDEPAQAVVWYPQVTVYGRVVPNPQATVEIRSPFAGTLRADPDNAWPIQGRWLRAGQVVGRLDIRVGPQERLDIQAKLDDARAKQEGAEDVLKVQQERMDRFLKQPGFESMARDDFDKARVAVVEARTQVATAKAAVDLWQKALDILDKRGDRATSPWNEPLSAPADGEVTELAGRPGTVVESGGLLARLVDFRRVLVRLELPPELLASGPPPAQVEIVAVPPATQPLGSAEAVESAAQAVPATLVGPAGQVDAVSQLAAYWYEADTTHRAKSNPTKKGNGTSSNGSTWRPGLFVQAHLKSSQAKPQQAVSIPQTALLIHQGRTLVYVRLSPGRYERREVRLLGREGDRWMVSAGVAAGEHVVYRQAQILLSEEFRGDVDTD